MSEWKKYHKQGLCKECERIAELNEEIIRLQKSMIKRLALRNNWLEEVVALAQEHYHIDLDHPDWPQWREEE